MLSVLAELQRELIMANANDALASARARGRVGGRRPKLTPDQAELAQRLYDAREKTVQQIADMFNVPRSTVYGHLDREKTVPRQPKKTAAAKPGKLPAGYLLPGLRAGTTGPDLLFPGLPQRRRAPPRAGKR
ncbi:helix-turn-helix domain-containing protein [Streptomyces sp. NPDC086549]|uniref:helix-turn-helix domain-containing protein n=1 Tax=Streptomyces sp. NPDC086549 TaxID=3365752 RepID=UPI00380EE514